MAMKPARDDPTGSPSRRVPRRFCVYLGCPDQSVDSVWARFRDRDGEFFSYCLEVRAETRPLPRLAGRCLEARAIAGPSYT